ncbi:hypothetical protein BJD99_08655 [Rhodococcus sp. 1163]|uniref:hypothetical protein n=1 Tax=unclassified Rhodococcus (in: high G+C Gram-positive bacteria) TaxID=192944 RepID=UPI000A00DA86|nr:hypothetical protein [Rhodococcus sp. 1163]ORI12994.1 hypothetical protein BJD99_08655 [Rhodococcus sp. 1163]
MTLTVRSAMLSAAIGKASGFRSSVGISAGLLALFGGTEYRRLAVGASVFAIAGEIVMDKLPSTPSRLSPPALGGRIVAGGGAAFAIARRRDEDTIPAAIIGGLSAIAGSYAGHAYRGWASTRIPPLAAAVVEDLVALAVGAAVAKQVLA